MKVGRFAAVLAMVMLLSIFAASNTIYAMDRPGGPEAWKAVEETESATMVERLNTAGQADYAKDSEIVAILANFAAGRADQTKTEAALKSKGVDLTEIAAVGGLLDELRPGGTSKRIVTAQMDAKGTPADLGNKGGSNIEEARRLASDAKTKTFPFSADFAQNSGQEMLDIIDQVVKPQKKIPVIITHPGQELTLIDSVQKRVDRKEIATVPVAPSSIAGKQFADAFKKHGFVALEMTLSEAKTAVESNEDLN